MAGFTPNEGEVLIGQVIFQRTHVDRAATLELGLFTDATPIETITEATIQYQFHITSTFEFFKDYFIHPAAGIDQRRCNDGQ